MLHKWTMRITATALLMVLLAACAQPATPGATSTAEPEHGTDHMAEDANTPFDAQFIDSMIVHHQGAIEMATAALEQAEREEVRTLADAILTAQAGEITQMQEWRSAWYPDQPATSGMEMEMAAMAVAEDASIPYDQRFLAAMIPHHRDAITMAETARSEAEHEDIRQLADEIIAAQQAEITQMQQWLQEWYGIQPD